MKSNNPSSYGEDKTFPDSVECARPHVGIFSSGGRVLPVGVGGRKKLQESIPHLTWEWYRQV